MVAPVKGVSGSDWCTPWMNLRCAMGIALPPEGLIMPAPDRHGQATERPLESGECGKWLRRLLGLDASEGVHDQRRVSSHSLKSTMLSFAAKRGLSVPDRLLLGYHASHMQMSLVYSRDGAAASLLLLERMIDEIVSGKFKPDSTRSGRIVESPVEPPGPQPSKDAKVKVEVVESSDDEVGDSGALADSSDRPVFPGTPQQRAVFGQCTKRSEEVQLAIRERPSTVQIENQQLKVSQLSEEFKAGCGSEIKLQWCLQRRGIAMDQCQLLSWATHEAWVQQLFRTLSQQPPPNFQAVKLEQLVRADRELWTLLAQEHKGSLKANAAGEIPLNDLFKRFCQDPRITMFLLPSPGGSKVVEKEVPSKRTTTTTPTQAAAKSTSTKKRKTRAEKQCPEELRRFQLRCEHGPVCGKRKAVSQEPLERAAKKGGAGRDRDVKHTCRTAAPDSPPDTGHFKDLEPESFQSRQRTKFAGKLVNDILIVEVCAGSARLTKVARDAGFHGLAIDHTQLRSCGIDICIFELEDSVQVDQLCNFIEEEADNIAAIWIAPSCGTASKARERKLPQLKKLGIAEPIPLRSQLQPDQLDGLDGTNKLKVEKANLLYDAVERIARTACNAKIFTGIENPANSHYWSTTPTQSLVTDFGDKYVTFHNCCHGGSRDKLTSVWVNEDWLDSLNARCDNSHPHKSWKVTVSGNDVHFPTAEEAAYPFVLCERIIHCIKQQVLFYGAVESSTLEQQLQQPDSDAAGRIALGSLPRGAKVKPLVSEFGQFIAAISPVQQAAAVDKLVAQQPKGARITSRQLWKRGKLRVDGDCYHFLAGSEQLPNDAMVELCWIGVPSEPDAFVARALEAGHPRGLDVHVNVSMQQVVNENLIDPPFLLAKKRVEFLKKWTARAKDLAPDEEKLREDMPEHVREVLGNKRLLLFKEILDDLNYPDSKLVTDIAAGFSLSGYMTKSHVFRSRSKRPALSLSTLKKLSRSFNTKSLESLKNRQDEDLERETWDETQKELDKGWVFLDEPTLKGRTYDLKSAYKQFAVSPTDRATLRMGVNVPGETDPSVIGFNSLPFGAVGSVAGFLRVSQALWYIGYFGLGLLWSAFYDDFTLLSRSELASSSSWSCETLFTLLGLKYATEGHKCIPFDSKFKTLGLEVDTSNFVEGYALVGHTQSRKDEIGSQLDDVLNEGSLGAKEAERLRGRMIFFEGFTFGRVANSSVKALSRFCRGPSKKRKLDDELRRALLFLRERVKEGKPLKIERSLHNTWLVFTDGACNPEDGTGSVGGVLYDPSGRCLFYFGESIPKHVMDDLFERSKNPIHEIEVLPVLIAALVWGEFFANSQVVYYIDNESARMAYIRGTGETVRASLLIQSFVETEAEQQHRVWFGRVPSFSNPADSPSRLEFSHVLKLMAARTSISWEMVSRHLGV
eukprot:s913_g23.t1